MAVPCGWARPFTRDRLSACFPFACPCISLSLHLRTGNLHACTSVQITIVECACACTCTCSCSTVPAEGKQPWLSACHNQSRRLTVTRNNIIMKRVFHRRSFIQFMPYCFHSSGIKTMAVLTCKKVLYHEGQIFLPCWQDHEDLFISRVHWLSARSGSFAWRHVISSCREDQNGSFRPTPHQVCSTSS